MSKIVLAPLVVAGLSIRQDAEGRYSLNDLHQASGGEDRHVPAKFLRLDSTVALIDEISNCPETVNKKAVDSTPGRYGGSSVVKELVYAYAMWISPSFHLKVIRGYDAMATGDVDAVMASMPPALANQFGGIVKAVVLKQMWPMILDAVRLLGPDVMAGEAAKTHIVPVRGYTAGEIWMELVQLPPVRGGAQALSGELVKLGCQVGCAQLGRSRSKLFGYDLCRDKRNVIKAFGEKYYREHTGQTALFAIPIKRNRSGGGGGSPMGAAA